MLGHIRKHKPQLDPLAVGNMVLTDIIQMANKLMWPQVGRILSVTDEVIRIQWFRGSLTGTWRPCTIINTESMNRVPWEQDIHIDAVPEVVIHQGFHLTNKSFLPKHVKDFLDQYDKDY
jgi:hypothetical protein